MGTAVEQTEKVRPLYNIFSSIKRQLGSFVKLWLGGIMGQMIWGFEVHWVYFYVGDVRPLLFSIVAEVLCSSCS